jgi:putative membrane protein
MTRTALTLIAALGLAACGSSGDHAADNAAAYDNAAMAENVATADAPLAVLAAPTPEFVTKVAISDMYEIEASKLALANSKNADIKAFAQQMVTDHSATTASVKKIVGEDKLAPPPAALDADHAKLIADLKAAKPDDFDGLYLDQQEDAHEAALALLQGYAAGGENAKLKAFAAETAPKVSMHLDMAKKLDDADADDTATTANTM